MGECEGEEVLSPVVVGWLEEGGRGREELPGFPPP